MNNREIKFRVWNNSGKYYVDLNDNFNSWSLSLNDGSVKFSQNCTDGDFGSQDVTLQQFTGLKDKNNKEIYEGDLLEISQEDQNEYYKPHCHVWYSEWNGSWAVSFNHRYSETSCDLYMVNRKYSVVGNLMENPDFLK